MAPGPRNKTNKLITSLALIALSCRALIPVGFMPASERPFSLIICHEGFPSALLEHGTPLHPGGTTHFEHCLFSGVTAAALAPTAVGVAMVLPVSTPLIFTKTAPPAGVRLVYVPPPRAPPPSPL